MRMLFEIDKKDYDKKETVFSRPSVRAVIVRNGRLAMVHSLKYDYYKFPGGGIEKNESHIQTLVREVSEETGLEVVPESVKEYGFVHRIQKGISEDVFIQDNFYYFCDVNGRIRETQLDDYEFEEGFVLEFVCPEYAAKVNASCTFGDDKDTIVERDSKVLELLMKELPELCGEQKTILETDRLVLRELTSNDFPDLCKILMDDETMYAYEGAFDEKMSHDWLDKQLARYKKYGFGLWAVTLKDTGEFIGQCGITMQDWNGEQLFEVGYLFNKDFWHNGYATEAAAACKEYAFEKLGAEAVCSIIRDTNIASQNVAKRNGMTKQDGVMVKHYRGVDMPHYLYMTKNKDMSDLKRSACSLT